MRKILRGLGVLLIVAGFASARAHAAVTVASFRAHASGAQVRLTWTTASELGNLGFNILRSPANGASYVRLNAALIPSQCLGCVGGASYAYVDANAAGQTFWYKLQSVASDGRTELFGPVTVGNTAPTAAVTPTPSPTATRAPTAVSSPTSGALPPVNAPLVAPPPRAPVPGSAPASAAPARVLVTPTGTIAATITRAPVNVTLIPNPDATPARATGVALAIKLPTPEMVSPENAAVFDEPDTARSAVRLVILVAAFGVSVAALGLGIAAIYFFARAAGRE